MRLSAISIRNFRSIKHVDLSTIGSVNTLIGKNNAGKSSILSAIDIALDHLNSGQVVQEWKVRGRISDQFSDRNTGCKIQLGLEIAYDEKVIRDIKSEITRETEGLDNAISNIEDETPLSIIRELYTCLTQAERWARFSASAERPHDQALRQPVRPHGRLS